MLFFCEFKTLILDNMLLQRCSNYLKYMEDFDYRNILVDSGTIVQWMRNDNGALGLVVVRI